MSGGAPEPIGGDHRTASGGFGRRRRRVARAAAILAGALVLGLAGLWVATPPGDDLAVRVTALAASHGVTVLQPGAVPPLLAEAVVAIEDERFYAHHGLDTIGLGRAFLYDVTHLCACQGGSTITQQLVKVVYLGGSDDGLAKLPDMVLALKVELHATKQQIMADYLSIVPTGVGRYGLADAACADFERPLGSLDLGQVALLAGLLQAPSADDPLVHPAVALARRQAVLEAMLDDGYITADQLAAAAAEPATSGGGSGPCSGG